MSQRLHLHIPHVRAGDNSDISAFPNGDNLFEWTCSLVGTFARGQSGGAHEVVFVAKHSLQCLSRELCKPCHARITVMCVHGQVLKAQSTRACSTPCP